MRGLLALADRVRANDNAAPSATDLRPHAPMPAAHPGAWNGIHVIDLYEPPRQRPSASVSLGSTLLISTVDVSCSSANEYNRPTAVIQCAERLGGKQTFNNRVRGNRLLAHAQYVPHYRPPRFANSCKTTFARMIALRCAVSE